MNTSSKVTIDHVPVWVWSVYHIEKTYSQDGNWEYCTKPEMIKSIPLFIQGQVLHLEVINATSFIHHVALHVV